MGFRFQRRIDLGSKWGLNFSGSGLSASKRTKYGSIGTKGFSIRTGIPGLSFRSNWGKNSGPALALIAVLFVAVASAIYIVLQVLAVLIPIILECIRWLALTAYDLIRYGIERFKAWNKIQD